MNADVIEDETLTELHKLLDSGQEVRLMPHDDQYMVLVSQYPSNRTFLGVGNDIAEALANAVALRDELVEEGSA